MQCLNSSGVTDMLASARPLLSEPSSFYRFLTAPVHSPSSSVQALGSGSPTRPLDFVFSAAGKEQS